MPSISSTYIYILIYVIYLCVHVSVIYGGEGFEVQLEYSMIAPCSFFSYDLFESKPYSLMLQIQIDWHELILPPILGMPVFAFLISMSTFTYWELGYGFALDQASIYHVCILCSCTFSFCHIYIYYLGLFNDREGHVISKINIWYIIYYMVRVVGCRCAMCNVQCAMCETRERTKKEEDDFYFH